jgi:hypothetical protein
MSRPLFVRAWAVRHLKAAATHGWVALRHLAVALRIGLGQVLAAVLALIVIFEEWGWRPLAAALGRLARFAPIAAIEAWVQRLPPYGALAVFGLPSLLTLPVKLLALWLIAQGQFATATAMLIGAKIVGTALIARLFMLTQPALMRIPWFKRAYDTLMPMKEALLAWVRESWAWRIGRILKTRIKKRLAPLVAAVRARLAAWFRRGAV